MTRGTVTSVAANPLGSELITDAAAGDTVLFVDMADHFAEEDGGQLLLNGALLSYDSADPDAETVTLSSPLAVAASVGDFVAAVEAGKAAVEWVADVAIDDGDTIPAVIPTSLIAFFPEGTYDDEVTANIALVDDEYEVTSQPQRDPSFDGQVVYNPHATLIPNVVSIPGDGTWTQLTSFTVVEADQMTVGTNVTIVVGGYYAYSVSIPYSSSPPGRRRVRLLVNGNQIGHDTASADDLTYTTVSINGAHRFAELDVVTVEVAQTSGAGLTLEATGSPTWSIYRVSV
jgi:hypothetical protein